MAYDQMLAHRLRAVLADQRDVSEKSMFGGLGFLIDGRLAVSASSRGGLLLRVDPAESETLLREPDVSPFQMRGRELNGWLHIGSPAIEADDQLRRWVEVGVARARALPAD